MNGTTTILICDDNEIVHQTLRLYFQNAGFQVISAYDGASALEKVRQKPIDLLLLDIMLPKMPGTEVCRQVRKGSSVPVIILSAKTNVDDRIAGLELGADDYIAKPFSPKEVVTRVKTVLRRTGAKTEDQPLKVGNLRVNLKAYEAFIGQERISMTPKEMELVSFLMERAGKVISREEILNTVWGFDYYGNVRTVDSLLARIRGKIPEKKAGVTFRSIYGVGYMIEECCGSGGTESVYSPLVQSNC